MTILSRGAALLPDERWLIKLLFEPEFGSGSLAYPRLRCCEYVSVEYFEKEKSDPADGDMGEARSGYPFW